MQDPVTYVQRRSLEASAATHQVVVAIAAAHRREMGRRIANGDNWFYCESYRAGSLAGRTEVAETTKMLVAMGSAVVW